MRLMSYSECLDYIRSDYYRITGRSEDSIVRMGFAGLFDVGFRFLFWWRLSKCNNKLIGGDRTYRVALDKCASQDWH